VAHRLNPCRQPMQGGLRWDLDLRVDPGDKIPGGDRLERICLQDDYRRCVVRHLRDAIEHHRALHRSPSGSDWTFAGSYYQEPGRVGLGQPSPRRQPAVSILGGHSLTTFRLLVPGAALPKPNGAVDCRRMRPPLKNFGLPFRLLDRLWKKDIGVMIVLLN
jgi:hypothetical protein